MSHPIIDLLSKFEVTDHKRLNWHEYFGSQALLASMRSPSEKLRVGAVIVSNNRIVSTGYNGYPCGVPHESIHVGGHEVNTIHAEQNAIADAAKRGVGLDQSVIYVTHYPCLNCAKMIIASGIKGIYYINDYNNDNVCQLLLTQSGVDINKLFK